MSNTIGTAYVQIEPSAKGISGSISNILDSEASAAGTSAGGKLSGALGAAAKVGVTAIAGATTAMVGFGTTAVNAGKDFDSSMSQVAATMGFSVEELNTSGSEASKTFEQLRDFAQEMGSATSFSATESAEALNYMALAGYDAETSMKTLPSVLNLAASGGIGLADASDMVTDALSAFGLNSEYASTMVDQMALTASKSNTSVAQLGEAYLTIGANAKQLSGGTQELSTMLGVLADNGIKGSEAGTHLRNIMLAMNPTTDKAANAWDKLGVSAYDAQGNLRPLEDTFGDLGKAMEGMSDQEKTDMLTAMFNKTDLASINALLGTEATRFDELSTAIGNASGAAEDMAGVQLDNLEGDVTLFKSAMEGLQIAVSDKVTPALRDFVSMGSDGISDITEKLRDGDIEGAFSSLGESLGEFTVKLSDMAPDVVDGAIKLLESFAEGIGEHQDEITESALKIITTLTEGLIEHIPELVDAAIDLLKSLAKYLTENLPELMPAALDMIFEIVDTLLDNIDELVDCALNLIIALADGLIDALPKIAEKAPEIIIKLVDSLTKNFPKIIETATEIIVKLAEGLIKAIPKLVAKVPEIVSSLLNAFKTEYEALKQAGSDIVEGIWKGIKENWENLKESVKDMASGLVETVKDFFKIGSPSKLMKNEIGKWIPEGIAVGIESNSDSVTDAIDDMNIKTFDSARNFTTDYSMQTIETSGHNTSDINDDVIGTIENAIISAMSSMNIYMDSMKVGTMVASAVDNQLGRLSARRV